MSRNRKPTTIAATIALFSDQAPQRIKENTTVLKYVMKFFETGLLAGVGLVRDIEDLPESERDAAAEALRTEFETAVMANFLNAVNNMLGNTNSPQARSGQYRASAGPTLQFVPADSADGTPESTAYEELLAKLVGSRNKPKSDCPPPESQSPQAREIVPGEAREIVPPQGKSGDAKGGV